MKHSAHIYDELMEVSPSLASTEKTNIFSVPELYFEELPDRVLQRIANPLHSLPASEPHFSDIPEGYFDSLPFNILNKIKQLETEDAGLELRNISPVLYALQNENVFSVPQGFFENIAEQVLNEIQPAAKVISIKRKNTFWKYASAAMIAGVIAVSALWVNNKPSDQTATVTNNATIPSFVKEATEYKNEQQVQDGISNLNDEDIINYLKATGNNSDDDLFATSVSGTDLPAEADYLLNDKTLDSFLEEIDNKNRQN